MSGESESAPRPANRSHLLKVVILGDGGVGKSCLMNRFVSNQFDEHSFHTIGVEFMNKTLTVDAKQYTLQVWDTAGQERFKSLRTPFYRGADVCLLAYSVDDRSSFHSLRAWLAEFLHYADVRHGVGSFPIIVVGNKCDVSSKEREVSREEVAAWCADHQLTACTETSAKSGANVQEAFVLAVRRWVETELIAEREMTAITHDTVQLRRAGGVMRSSCCTRSSLNNT